VQEKIAENPASPEARYVEGLVYLNLHMDVEAARAFEAVLRGDPGFFPALWGRAEVLRRQHKLKESQEILNGIIKTHPDFSPAYITLAYSKFTQLDFAQAVVIAQKVTKQGKNNVDLSNYVRSILIVSGSKGMLAHYGGPISKIANGTAVFPLLTTAQRLKPDDPGVLFGLGSVYLLAPGLVGGDVDKAQEYLQKTIKVDPLFVDAYVRLAQFYRYKGDKDKFRFYLDKALKIDPQNELALDVKSGACRYNCANR
jgi:tetratricopeptide (TPR) repeat protein